MIRKTAARSVTSIFSLVVVVSLFVAKATPDDTRPAFLDPAAHPDRKCVLLNGGTGVYWDSSYFCPGRYLVHEWKAGDERAGNPRSISCLARPSNGPYDDGYYVGGGCAHPCKADLRCCDEGTWGWDYMGHGILSPIVDLGYWHGRRDQTGSYKVDGPKVFHHE
jgi:hypothetical protein